MGSEETPREAKKRDKRLSTLDRLIQQTVGSDRRVGLDDDPAAQAYPTLWDWLSRIDAGKNHVMQPGRLSITLGPEGVIATVLHGDLGYTASITCKHLADVFQAWEDGMCNGTASVQPLGKRDPKIRKRKTAN